MDVICASFYLFYFISICPLFGRFLISNHHHRDTQSKMSAQISHPNFPHGLDIRPLVLDNDENEFFNVEAQERAIQRFGIAGRIW